MNMRRPVFFSIAFWLLAAGVLFVNAWPNARNHFDVAFMLYAYFVVIGLLASGVMMAAFASDWFRRQHPRLIWVTMFSVIAALITALLISPITYMMAGHNIRAVPIEIVSTGTLYFALLFVIWSALYLYGGSVSSQCSTLYFFKIFNVSSSGIASSRPRLLSTVVAFRIAL
jgi:hypothetical protein